MSESDAEQSTRRHGRRARRLTPEETAQQQVLAAQHTGEQPRTSASPSEPSHDEAGPADAAAASAGSSHVDEGTSSSALPAGRPASRGAVAPPTADAPVPKLRKFGKRARIVEVEPDPDEARDDATAGDTDGSAQSSGENAAAADGAAEADGAGASRGEHSSAGGHAPASASRSTSGPAASAPSSSCTSTATIERDADGVELGELTVSEAPGPKPAPRFEGRVLSRPEQGRGRPLLWIVWVLIALAIIALVVLLATGVLGPGSAQAQGLADHLYGAAAAADPSPSPATLSDLEVTSA
ncbi:hypothetical protein DEO23_13170 [Brachybacterium endophyticum]|uniref:Uncharacterized protein n=1 Tax=Brachybacterium endophyticum TaxID=2182385 RepID=A0A2U2RI11_9MICO|nr:hypothetical protein [Brachybacterium endophyticum]PWH05513.1 hypothetical protein DEO23_13170 [Brachybacterium endophyticum]